MRRSKEDSEQTRAAILDAAERMFCEKGYAAATVELISRAAGLTRGAFYWHFRDKADVLAALHARTFLPQEKILTGVIESDTPDPLDCLFLAAAEALRSFEVTEGEQRIFRIMSDLTIGQDGREAVARIHAEMRALIRTVMQRAEANGTLNPRITVAEAELYITVTIGGLLAEWLRSDKCFPLALSGERLLRHLMTMLRTDQGAAPRARQCDSPRPPGPDPNSVLDIRCARAPKTKQALPQR